MGAVATLQHSAEGKETLEEWQHAPPRILSPSPVPCQVQWQAAKPQIHMACKAQEQRSCASALGSRSCPPAVVAMGSVLVGIVEEEGQRLQELRGLHLRSAPGHNPSMLLIGASHNNGWTPSIVSGDMRRGYGPKHRVANRTEVPSFTMQLVIAGNGSGHILVMHAKGCRQVWRRWHAAGRMRAPARCWPAAGGTRARARPRAGSPPARVQNQSS